MSISCRGLGVSYNSTPVLVSVDVEVAAGEWVAVVGPNGAGKSTLLRAIAGLVPSGGDVLVDDEPTSSLTARLLAKRVALLPQHPVIPGGVSVLDYVLLGRTPHLPLWSFGSESDTAIARRVLAELDLTELSGRSVDGLSGGELQRTVLARALAQEPTILLLDEPTASLDIGHAQQVLELVENRCRRDGISVLAAMHDLTFAGQYVDRVLLLVGGVVSASGRPAEVLTASVLSDHYQADVVVLEGPGGEPVIVPRRRSVRAPPDR